MKFKNMTHRVKTNICFALLFLAASFISSCQKDNSPAPDANLAANVTNANLTPLATTTSKYKLTAPLYYINKSNFTINGDSINGGNSIGINLLGCTNVHITKCKIMNSTNRGISIYGCTNVLVDSCFVSNVVQGIYVHSSTQVRIQSNQLLNMKAGGFIQFDDVTGSYNRISFNKCEDVLKAGTNPNPAGGDGINLYKSKGLPNDPIYVIGNYIRGGGTNTGPLGMSGIVAGDGGIGQYQDIENNILVNPGYAGIQHISGSNITIKNNKIFSSNVPWSGVGLCTANYSNLKVSGNVISNNQINWIAGYLNMARTRNVLYKPNVTSVLNPVPTGWSTNVINAPAVTASILPAVMIKP